MTVHIHPEVATRLGQAISEPRLWARHEAMGAIGATPRGGVKRLALSDEDARAQALLCQWAQARGYDCARDTVGNLWVTRPGTSPDAPSVVSGSHLDSQPTGGKYDGTYGVLAALEVLEALDDAGISTHRSIEVVAWMNEEGSRFLPGAMGSGTYAGVYSMESSLARTDAAGVSVSDALAGLEASMPLPRRALPGMVPFAYLEAHIEQGPILENQRTRIGVVTGIQGIRRFVIEVLGEEAHAGTTPRAHRQDAVLTAVALIADLERAAQDDEDKLRFTVGRIEVLPNSPNTVPSRVMFTIDLRHPDDEVLERFAVLIEQRAAFHAERRRCRASVSRVSTVKPVRFPTPVTDLLRSCAQAEQLSWLELPSGAGHDAMHIHRLCPTGMIFVPCLRGVSHNEAESASATDLAAGTRVLARALLELANRT